MYKPYHVYYHERVSSFSFLFYFLQMSMDHVANEVIVRYELNHIVQDMVFVPNLKIMEQKDAKKIAPNPTTQNIRKTIRIFHSLAIS